jgi:hypothetical protein
MRRERIQSRARPSNISWLKWLPGVVGVVDQLGAVELKRPRRVRGENLGQACNQLVELPPRYPTKRPI